MSTKRSKRYQEAAKLVTPNKNYSITEAVETMKSFPAPKFDPTVTVSFHLTVDPRKSDQMVRGSVSLPNGTGKTSASSSSPRAMPPRPPRKPEPNSWGLKISSRKSREDLLTLIRPLPPPTP